MHAVFATSLETPAQSVVNCVSYPENCLLHKQDGEWSMKRMHERPTPKKLQHITTNCRFVYAVLLWTQFFLNLEHLTMCDCCGEWCLEIKCPFKYTTDSIKQALDAQDKDFCLESAANGLHLKRAHPYYLQVQTLCHQLQPLWPRCMDSKRHGCGTHLPWCRFLGTTFEESTRVLQKKEKKKKKVCLPELVGKYFSEHSSVLNAP